MANEVEKKVLMTIKKLDKKFDGKSQYVIEVVQYNDSDPQLIKQQYYKTEDGTWLPGKLKGFTYEDISFLRKVDLRKELFKVLKD